MMKRTRSEIKTSLLAEIEKELEQALDWQGKAERPNLTEFENQLVLDSIGNSHFRPTLTN